MKTKMKKLLSLVLALTMCLSLVQVAAFAYTTVDQIVPPGGGTSYYTKTGTQDTSVGAALTGDNMNGRCV